MSLGANLVGIQPIQKQLPRWLRHSPEEHQKREYQADSEYYKVAKAIIKQLTLDQW